MDSFLPQKLISGFVSAREQLTPIATTSRLSEGLLTPVEYVEAGDALCYSYPSWKWSPAPRQPRPYLPKSKQVLVLSGVRSSVRAKDISAAGRQAFKDRDGGFAEVQATSLYQPHPEEMTRASRRPLTLADLTHESGMAGWALAEAEEDIQDPAAWPGKKQVSGTSSRLRMYDVHLVYDGYYRVPHLYLIGYDSRSGERLTPGEMMEDVHEDQSGATAGGSTATMEAHPLGMSTSPCLSIHPCRHAKVMASAIAGVSDPLQTYMPAFLKLLAGAAPGLEFDWTTSTPAPGRGRPVGS